MLTVRLVNMADRQKTEMVAKRGEGPEEELVQLCRKMRLMSERDTDATLPLVLRVMMVHSRGQPVGGSQLSELSGINRITIIHHMKRLEGAGLVRREEGKYILRVRSAEDMILEFRKEMERNFAEMDEMARDFDEQFSLMARELDESFKRRRRLP
ncbi:MAG: helix-turn-helix domain-containing protein [Candidatus Micrarchaeia archaeon]|jgi:DNA-binding transcriptional ArsR family regulator